MKIEEQVVTTVAAVLEQDPYVNLHEFPLQLDFASGVLTLEGNVENIMAKKRALEVAGAISGVDRIVDRLRLVPASPMQDGEIRDHVCNSLVSENYLGTCAVWAIVKGKAEVVREADQDMDGNIDVEVQDGVVVLNGAVSSLSAKRVAGVMAWWVPGSRDVVNGLEVIPPQEDSDDEVVDAVCLVLEKDPFVNASQIRVRSSGFNVTLEGVVRNQLEKKFAESDAWYVFRVDQVTNLLMVSE
ncbi:BON domain-containing protein [Pelotalea chapellei]|uniref:BON domain-containing protein n=1 Tax=Pelotalea chapellei TaxID=44671 RepID=A0ABS5U9Z1_9BACT|nr:BON domain-containing protein [Pelotalea chapellei]MBT1072451.1 BON domain-containing protein [Pelotalea chapellei]